MCARMYARMLTPRTHLGNVAVLVKLVELQGSGQAVHDEGAEPGLDDQAREKRVGLLRLVASCHAAVRSQPDAREHPSTALGHGLGVSHAYRP